MVRQMLALLVVQERQTLAGVVAVLTTTQHSPAAPVLSSLN
jgi:hypothetical protein